jgi:hypothetical protein
VRSRSPSLPPRRDFLRQLGLGAAALGGAGLASGLAGGPLQQLWQGAPGLFLPRQAHAFGVAGPEYVSSLIPVQRRAKNVLEIFLYGGVSQFESFYAVREHGKSDFTHSWLYQQTGDLQNAANQCGIPAGDNELFGEFATDSEGQVVSLGPFVAPLRARPDLLQRLRVMVTSHDLEPHEAAIPQMLGGRGLGNPALAGLGAHIQRYFQEQEGIAGRAPYSYVLLQQSLSAFPTDNLRAATAIGQHPGSARPLSLTVDGAGELAELLMRGTVGSSRKAWDDLVQSHISRYRQRLQRPEVSVPVRTPRWTDLQAAAAAVSGTGAVEAMLPGEFFAKQGIDRCGDKWEVDPVAMNLRLAAHLLTHPQTPARYVCVLDGGLLPADGGGGYDTHEESPFTQTRNLGNTLAALTSLINTPGEADPDKLNLDDTLIVLTTEFGRTPFKQGQKGRNHWPYGFPVVMLGGPVRADNAGVYGACGEDGRAISGCTPQENRIAALSALGIWPFANESFNVADVTGAANEAQAAQLVGNRVLGLAEMAP